MRQLTKLMKVYHHFLTYWLHWNRILDLLELVLFFRLDWWIRLKYSKTLYTNKTAVSFPDQYSPNSHKLPPFCEIYQKIFRIIGFFCQNYQYCHTRVQLGIQSELNSCKYHLAVWATKWHDYVPVDHPPTTHPPTTRRVTWDLGTGSFIDMEM